MKLHSRSITEQINKEQQSAIHSRSVDWNSNPFTVWRASPVFGRASRQYEAIPYEAVQCEAIASL